MPKKSSLDELLGSENLAKKALLEITDESTIGALSGHEVDDSGAVTLFFECTMKGYPGWRWAASLAKATPEAEPTVLEVELLPGEGALLSPEWVPWSVRLAAYKEQQAALEAERLANGDESDDAEAEVEDELDDDLDDDDADDADLDDDELDEDDDEDEILDNDFSDFDDEIDGVDIDALDEDELQDDEDEDEDAEEDADDGDAADAESEERV